TRRLALGQERARTRARDRTAFPGMTDSVTILTCAPGKRAHKIFRADGTVDDFDAGGLFKFTTIPVASLLELCVVIETVRTRTDAFLIYGEPVRHFAVAQPRKWAGENP